MVGASDAGAHLDMIAAFRYSTGFLHEAVRERSLLALEEAVHMLTAQPANLYGMHDRGVLREGARADVVVFDETTIGSTPVETRFDLPGGAGRLYADATGIGHVLVNGVEVVVDGGFTGALPGRVLRSGTDTRTPSMIL
jgi:N-acyl-D-aspartate/D-glutamate deacylase